MRSANSRGAHLPSLHNGLQWSLPSLYLDGLHRVILVQFVDVVRYAGVERGGRDRMDDSGIVGLLLVPLAVGVDKERKEAAEDGAAQPHGDHVEHVEFWGDSTKRDATQGRSTRPHSSVGLVQRQR